jgi:glycosyltransferase involved in cell wall biosynthesis
MKISAAIITFNEEKNIKRCLLSLQGVVDEIVVVDSFSTDKTEEICSKFDVVFIKNKFLGHIEQKNFALYKTKYSYVLSLDADEVLSSELKESILNIKQENQKEDSSEFDSYSFNRLTNYCNERWIKHCGWYPDIKLRLWNKEKGSWGGENPHDMVIMQKGAKTKWIKGDLLHYSYHSVQEHINQLNKFTTIGALESYKKGKKASIGKIIIKTIWKFLRDYIFKGGFLDGFAGFKVCSISAFATFTKYVKLRELYK